MSFLNYKNLNKSCDGVRSALEQEAIKLRADYVIFGADYTLREVLLSP